MSIGDDYDLRFEVEYEKYTTYAQGYFSLFSLFQSPKRLFEDGEQSDHCGCGAMGAMALNINKKGGKEISIRIYPQQFYISRFQYAGIELIEQFLTEYSTLHKNWKYDEKWKSIMQDYIDYYNKNKKAFIDGKRREYFEIFISRTPIYFHISSSEFIKKVVRLQETILSLPVSNEDIGIKEWFNETLDINRQLLQKFNDS